MDEKIMDVFCTRKCWRCLGEGEGTLLEILWRYHKCRDTENDAVIKEKFDMLQQYLKQLSQKRKRVVVARIGDLCAECERAAFIEGVRVGSRLILELTCRERLHDDDMG